ncbi:VanZ family protein [Agathobaculum sp. Marseille-P7918]|uniref:VanZ family protein n=1 Tax=Agathobaculum sp. Marseille-P7918 TaxID=2479843 RepID=UPI000F63BE01|nr:VanZ family protein [Agathobaculum sp. Marseille-P7918]
MKRRDLFGVLVLLLYLLGVGLVTGPSLYQLLVGRLPVPKLELIPFADMIAIVSDQDSPGLGAVANIAGNAVLLAPLGFLLPLFWSYFDGAKRTILFGFGMSLSIELIQLVAGGVTSVDDLILNTVGAALGFALAKLLLRSCPWLAPQRDSRAAWGYPLACWLAVIVLATVTDVMALGLIW